MKSEELERIENHIRHTRGHKYEDSFEWKLATEIRTLQQQKNDLLDGLKWSLEKVTELGKEAPLRDDELDEHKHWTLVYQSIQGGTQDGTSNNNA